MRRNPITPRASLFTPFVAMAMLLSCVGCPGDDICGDDDTCPLEPYRGEWERVAAYPVGPEGFSEITIGGVETGDNFANRGDVEVYFTAPQVEIPGLGFVDQVIVEMREFTVASSESAAQADFDRLEPWLYAVANVAPPAGLDPLDACNPRSSGGVPAVLGTCSDSGADCNFDEDCDGGSCQATELWGWADRCQVRVYWPGQIQKSRAGADIRVYLPPDWRGRVEVVTEDNLAEPGYPDLSDVRIVDLAGSARIELEAGRVDVRLADEVLPVPACDAMTNEACLDAGWGRDEVCATSCTDFGRVEVRPRGQQPVQARVDAPAGLWMTADMKNTLAGLTRETECPVSIGGAVPSVGEPDCGPFGECRCLDCDEQKPFARRVVLNKPGPDAIDGLGYSISLESGDCTDKDFVEGPDDFMARSTELRGQLELCSGCLQDMFVPTP